ncbi:MAG: PASTA domain-containing protein [Gemmatimonadota bacterium]
MKLGSSMRRRRAREARPSRKQREEGISHLLLALAVLVFGVAGGYVFATQAVFPGPERLDTDLRDVPDLRGMRVAEAETILRERGLQPGTIDSIRHPDAPEGAILGQMPLPGQLAEASGRVEFTLSLGPERRLVPDVSELRLERAVTVLEASGFGVEVDSIEAEIAEGRVVETLPEAGEELPLPSVVRVTVSLGPPMVTVPLLAGLQEEEARRLLDSLGLEVSEVESRFRFGFNQGEVLEHFPPPDSTVVEGSGVRLVIGRRGFFEDP